MRYVLAGLVLAVAALVWWGTREPQPARGASPRPASAEQPLDPEVAPALPSEEEGLLFLGRVVADRKGASGARVTVEIHGQGRFDTRAGDDGAYSLRTGRRPERGTAPVRVEARLGDRGASADLTLSPRSLDRIRVPTLVLGPLHPFPITVRGGGKPLPGARVVTGEPARPGGVSVTGLDGRVELLLPAGEHEIRAACDGFGRAETKARVPEAAAASIELPRERTVTVTVVDKASGRPVAGAVLSLHEEREGSSLQLFSPPVGAAPTDERGMTVLRGLAEETVVRVAVRAPGYPPPAGSVGKETILGGVTELRIELPPPRAIRWPVVAGELPAPPDGTAIGLRPWPGSYLREVPAGGVMERAHLVVDGWGPGHVHAIAQEPGGGLAYLQAGREVGPEIAFRRPRRVDVFAHEPSGAPVEGAAFLLRAAPAPLGLTSAEGRLAFEGLYGGRAEVHHLPNPSSEWGMTRVGIVDLEAGDGFVDVVLRPAVELVVRVRVEGEPRIPAGYALYADSALIEAEEDFERGILRARVRPVGESIPVALGAPGFAPVRTETRTGDVEIDLRSGATLSIEVIRPPEAESAVEVQVWREDWKAWTQVFLPMGEEWKYRKLAPGRYRAVDRRSGAVSEEVRLDNGSAGRIVLDLSRTGLVRGRVEMPEGTDAAYVFVQVSGIESNRVGIAQEGTFLLGVPGDRAITLRASHPTLRAANEVALTRPRDDVVLRLEPGPTATLELDAVLRDPIHMRPEVPVLLYRGGPEGEPAARLRAAIQGKKLAFGGFDPGTYGVWIDARPYAPIALLGVTLGDGVTDFGRISLGLGSRVRVRILVPEGQIPPRISLSAWRTTEPAYSRNVDSRGEAEVTLSGLGPGTFRVSAEPISTVTSRSRLEQDVTLDGVETRELVLDLR